MNLNIGKTIEGKAFTLPVDLATQTQGGLDEYTEALTQYGWKSHKDLVPGNEVIAFDPKTADYKVEPIELVITAPFDGEMLNMKSDGIDSLSALSHRLVLRRVQRAQGRYGVYQPVFCEAGRMPCHVYIESGGAAFGLGVPGLSFDVARILGLIITDGYWAGKPKGKYLGICQSKASVKHGRSIVEVLDELLLPRGATKKRRIRVNQALPNGKRRDEAECEVYYLGVEFTNELLLWLGQSIHRVPRRILANANKEQLEALYLGLLEGNGTSDRWGWRTFYPGQNEGQADDFQEVATRLGVSTTKVWVKSIGQWHVRITQRKHHYIRRKSTKHYSGIVWNMRVPSGAFVARRAGKVFVIGGLE